MGLMYSGGNGVKKDKKKAFNYFFQSAELNNSFGQYCVGYCYELGEGVSKNKREAINWYKKSASQGEENAKTALNRLGVY